MALFLSDEDKFAFIETNATVEFGFGAPPRRASTTGTEVATATFPLPHEIKRAMV